MQPAWTLCMFNSAPVASLTLVCARACVRVILTSFPPPYGRSSVQMLQWKNAEGSGYLLRSNAARSSGSVSIFRFPICNPPLPIIVKHQWLSVIALCTLAFSRVASEDGMHIDSGWDAYRLALSATLSCWLFFPSPKKLTPLLHSCELLSGSPSFCDWVKEPAKQKGD